MPQTPDRLRVPASPTLRVPASSISKERLEGYKAALADHGIALEESLIRFAITVE